MAAALANNIFKSRGIAAMADSCGVFAIDNASASKNAVRAMKDGWSTDILEHKAKTTTEPGLSAAHIIITMTQGHKSHLCALYPDFADKIYAVKEISDNDSDIDDPFGANLETYMQCARQIEHFLEYFDWEGYL